MAFIFSTKEVQVPGQVPLGCSVKTQHCNRETALLWLAEHGINKLIMESRQHPRLGLEIRATLGSLSFIPIYNGPSSFAAGDQILFARRAKGDRIEFVMIYILPV